MRKTLTVFVLSAILLGCASQNPAYTPIVAGQPDTNTVPRYVPNTALAQASNAVAQVTNALAPANPYAGVTDIAVKGVFGVGGLIAGIVAGFKNRQKVVDAMAAGVVKAGPTAAQAVVDHASTTPHFTAVIDAINEQTGANQSLTGTTKTG